MNSRAIKTIALASFAAGAVAFFAQTSGVAHAEGDINIGVGELQECTISKSMDSSTDDGTVDAADYVVWRKTDGVVDSADYVIWRKTDGVNDSADYLIWQEQFGSTSSLDADGQEYLDLDSGDTSESTSAGYNTWRTNFGRTS